MSQHGDARLEPLGLDVPAHLLADASQAGDIDLIPRSPVDGLPAQRQGPLRNRQQAEVGTGLGALAHLLDDRLVFEGDLGDQDHVRPAGHAGVGGRAGQATAGWGVGAVRESPATAP